MPTRLDTSADFFFYFFFILAPPVCASPSIFAVNAEPETIFTVDGIESLNTYANGAATIGLRISGNLRGRFSLFPLKFAIASNIIT